MIETITSEEVSKISPYHADFFAGKWYQGCGNFVSNHRSNLGSIACHSPWATFRRGQSNIEVLSNCHFVTGYDPNEMVDKILFNPKGTYKKLFELSGDLKLVIHNGKPVALKIPDEWTHWDYHTLLYSFLIQTRENIEYKTLCVNGLDWMKLGFDEHESYCLSRHFDLNKASKLNGFNGGHAIFSEPYDLVAYRNGEPPSSMSNGYYTSSMWRGRDRSLNKFPFEMYQIESSKFGKPAVYDTEKLTRDLKIFFERMKK